MPIAAETQAQRRIWAYTKSGHRSYARSLRSVARQIGVFAKELFPEPDTLEAMLIEYAKVLVPFARTVASRMLIDVSRRDEAAWNLASKRMSRALAQEVQNAPIGARLHQLQNEQVTLITSLPLNAAQRVHELVEEARVSTAARASEISKMIRESGEVAKSRADLIARTEVGRVAANLTQARAEYVGAEGYIWRSSEDEDVRSLHRKLNGKFIKWSAPPVAGHGKGGAEIRAHAGCIFNCRCYPEPVVPEG
jgi:SPP1 gp7 family putative phage head morphogenesis protein